MATPPPRVNPSNKLDTYLSSWLPSWKPTSEDRLIKAEKNVLKYLETSYDESFIPVGPDSYMHTIVFEADQPPSVDEEPPVPLVMIHGFGCGIPQFYKNFDHLHSNRKLYAIDLPGFARSTRVEFSADAEQCEEEFVNYIEKWREGVGLDKFILLGHSLGAFLSCAYTMRHPSRVRHLVLDDPWGFPLKPTESEGNSSTRRQLPLVFKAALHFTKIFNPLAPIRAAGPLGPYLINRYRPDLATTFSPEFMDYVYHSNAQSPTGETAFFHMQIPLAWAKRPMLERIDTDMDPSVPISFIYGSHSWMSSSSGTRTGELRHSSYVKVYIIPTAGHHVHADQPEAFNRVVNSVLNIVDKNEDTMTNDQLETSLRNEDTVDMYLDSQTTGTAQAGPT